MSQVGFYVNSVINEVSLERFLYLGRGSQSYQTKPPFHSKYFITLPFNVLKEKLQMM